jgi:hypothetical protein
LWIVTNRDYILFHLREARAGLDRTIREVEGRDGDTAALFVAMGQLYHHINTAWNARDASPERAAACTEADFVRWRQFPLDIDLAD